MSKEMPDMGGPKTPDELNKLRKMYQKETSEKAKGISGFISELLDNTDVGVSRFKHLTPEEIMYSDAEAENKLRASNDSKTLKNEANSAFTGRSSDYIGMKQIEGIVDGKKIQIVNAEGQGKGIYGKIDGEKISERDASLIWAKYYKAAEVRTNRLRELDEEKIEEKTQEKIKGIL